MSTNSSKDLGDISYLLFLKAEKKMKDNEVYIRRQLEEKERQLLTAKAMYMYLYEKYVSCAQLAATRSTLEQHASVGLSESDCNEIKENIATIMNKIASSTVLAHVDKQKLADCKEKLNLQPFKLHDELRQLREDISVEKEAAKDICAASCDIRSNVEAATEQILDHWVNEFNTEEN